MISTASYAARKFGVRRWVLGGGAAVSSAPPGLPTIRQRLGEAVRRLCKDGILGLQAWQAHCTHGRPLPTHPSSRSAMPGFIAVKLCPQLIFVPPDFEKYRLASEDTR